MYIRKIDQIVDEIYSGNFDGVDSKIVDLLSNILEGKKNLDKNLFLNVVQEINLAVESNNYVIVVDILHFILREIVKE